MKKRIIFFTIAAFLLIHLSSCLEEEVLPAVTQEGNNTFGCLVNGKVWVPEGYDGTRNLDLSYDPTYAEGAFNLHAYKILDGVREEDIVIYASGVKGKGDYNLNVDSSAAIFYNSKCGYDRDENVSREGVLTITYFDLSKAIISGTFEFTLTKPGCDTIRVTEGRFDMKI